MNVDVAAQQRWYRCEDCEVSWHDASSTCWVCGRDTAVALGAPTAHRDQFRPAAPSADRGTPLSRFGTRVEKMAGPRDRR